MRIGITKSSKPWPKSRSSNGIGLGQILVCQARIWLQIYLAAAVTYSIPESMRQVIESSTAFFAPVSRGSHSAALVNALRSAEASATTGTTSVFPATNGWDLMSVEQWSIDCIKRSNSNWLPLKRRTHAGRWTLWATIWPMTVSNASRIWLTSSTEWTWLFNLID